MQYESFNGVSKLSGLVRNQQKGRVVITHKASRVKMQIVFTLIDVSDFP